MKHRIQIGSLSTFRRWFAAIVCVLVLIAFQPIKSQTVLKDTLRNVTLTKENSPYHLVETVYISGSLKIHAGVGLIGDNPSNRFQDYATLFILQGSISALGTEEDSVIFDAVNVEIPTLPWNHDPSLYTYCHFKNNTTTLYSAHPFSVNESAYDDLSAGKG